MVGPGVLITPIPHVIMPSGPLPRRLPNAYAARRDIALPATTFSPIAYSSN